MRSILILFLLFGLGVPAEAKDAWSRTNGRVTLDAARISFPDKAGALPLVQTREFSHPGESLDAVAQYESTDQKVFATVYVYYPGMAHSGLAALATDAAIRLRSGDHAVKTVGSQIVAAGGMSGVAVRTDYDNFLGELASSAAFIKAGRWMVKLRVSGPRDRQGEIGNAMSTLLDNVRFEGESVPRAATLIETPECRPSEMTDARLLPDKEEITLFHALSLAVVDPEGGKQRTKRRDREEITLPSRIGTSWCRSYVDVQGSNIQLLHATDTETPGNAGTAKSMLLALYSDAGGTFEIVREREFGTKYVLLEHGIGSTSLLGSFDALPSDRQMADLLAVRGEGNKLRAKVSFKANGDSNVELMMPAPAPPSPTT